MARISIEDAKSEHLMDRLTDLETKTEDGRLELNTKTFESGLELQELLQEIKENIAQTGKDLEKDMYNLREKIEEKYNCQIEMPNMGDLTIQKNGDTYTYRLHTNQIELVNGKPTQKNKCPQCGKTDYTAEDFEGRTQELEKLEKTPHVKKQLKPHKQKEADEAIKKPMLIYNQCQNCGLVFARFEKENRHPQKQINEAEKIAKIHRKTFTEAHNTLVEHLENMLGKGRENWITETTYQYQTPIMKIQMPSLPSEPEQIQIEIETDNHTAPQRPYHPDVVMWRSINNENERYPEDYRKLLDELATLNGCEVKILGYSLNFENPNIIALVPREPNLKDREVEPLSDPINPVDGHGYTVEPIEKEAVRNYFQNTFEKEEKVEQEMDKYEKAAFVEINENIEVPERKRR